MKHGERRDLIRHRLACITPSKRDVEERLARLEAVEIAMGRANYARRFADFEAHARLIEQRKAAIPEPQQPRPATEEGDAAPPRTQG